MYRSLVIPSPELTPHSRTHVGPPVTRDRSPQQPPIWAPQQGGTTVAISGTSASFAAAGALAGTHVGRTLSPQRVKRNILSASPLRATASPLRALRGSPVSMPTDKRSQQDPTLAPDTTCRGVDVVRDADGTGHGGVTSTPPPAGVAADFQHTIDRLRSDNAACQARLDILVEANRQRKYVMRPSDHTHDGDVHWSDMNRFGSSEWGNVESSEGSMKPLGLPRPLPDSCSASSQDIFKLRNDLDNSQAHASTVDKAISSLRRELHSVREQLLLQSTETQQLVQELRQDVDALRSGGGTGGHSSERSCGRSVRHGGLSPVVRQESAASPGIGDMQVQELRSELLDLRGALRTVDAECRRIAATSAAGPPSWSSDGRRRVATGEASLQPLHEELYGLRLDVQRLEQETAPLVRSIGALWAEVANFRAEMPDPSQAWAYVPPAAAGSLEHACASAPLSTTTSIGIGISHQRPVASPRNATLGCSAGFHLQPHLSSSRQTSLQDADPRAALLQGAHSLEHQELVFEAGCYSALGTSRSHMPVARMMSAEDEEASRKMLSKQPVVGHSTLDSTSAQEDLLRALQAVQEMQDHDVPLMRCGLLSSDIDSCRD